ncbi:unnamed protein product [Macrosiphum euphorbiae]|nr:unnamed protein product [Macrosiphum euphorbiae]
MGNSPLIQSKARQGKVPGIPDIALINLPSINYTLTNHNDLSSDHNPIQLNIQASPISRNPRRHPTKSTGQNSRTNSRKLKYPMSEHHKKLTTK